MSPSCLCCLLLLALAVLGEEEDGQSRDGSHSVAQCAKPTAPGIESVSNQREPNRDYYNRGEEVTVTCAPGYQSVSQIIRCKKTEKNGTRSNWDVSLPCIAPGKPDFTQYPSINNNTLKWRLSETHGVLTGYQLNISAHREYDITFSETESHWLGPNVTEFNMELRNGTNYTVTLRGFTVSGPGEPAVWAHETSIGEPLLPLKNQIAIGDTTATFQLHPVPDSNGPISSYEIIVSGGWNGSLRQLCTSYTSTRYNSSQVPTLYTAVLLPAVKLTKSRTFTLGDGLYYDGFFNSPLSPDWNYKVYLRVTSKWKEVEKASCTCLDPYVVSLKLEITGVPSPTETVLQWRRVGGSRRDITGYQLNMVAWKEHTVIEEESQRLPPNVMEHRIPMEPGSSYMVTVRALTAAGPGEASLWLSGTPKATGASDSYVRVSLVLKPLFLTVLILILLCVTVREKWEQRGAGAKRHRRDTGRGGSEEMAPL